jgi:tetratricopeptide (TPR) repeat protein
MPHLDFKHRATADRLMPQARAACALIREHKFAFPEAIELLVHVGVYLKWRNQYRSAEPLFKLAVAIAERRFAEYATASFAPDAEERDAAARQAQATAAEQSKLFYALRNAASFYKHREAFARAEKFYERELELRKRLHGEEAVSTLKSMSNLSELYRAAGSYRKAERLCRKVLAAREPREGKPADWMALAKSLNNLVLSQVCYERNAQIWYVEVCLPDLPSSYRRRSAPI